MSTRQPAYRILFVDEEESLLRAYERSLQGQFQVVTQLGGKAALEHLLESDPYPVIFVEASMRRMPAAQFIGRCLKVSPRSLFVIIASPESWEPSLRAVCPSVFRVVFRPMSMGVLKEASEHALAEFARQEEERDRLERVTQIAVSSWISFLAASDPEGAKTAETVRDRLRRIVGLIDPEGTQDLELAAALADVGRLGLPSELQQKLKQGEELTGEEQQLVASIPELGSDLVAGLPGFEKVSELIRYRSKNFDGTGIPQDRRSGPEIPRGARLLHLLEELGALERQGLEISEAFQKLRAQRGRFDPRLLEVCEEVFAKASATPPRLGHELPVEPGELSTGDLLLVNLQSSEGSLLLSAGVTLNDQMIMAIRRQSQLTGVRRPIFVERGVSSRTPLA
ncbi:MAG: HD domain-containing phosphohydrolase [Planctomycetota bacterium]